MKLPNVEDIYPLSPLQQGMLFHTLYAPSSGVYFLQSGCTIQGDLDIPAFKHAWQQVVDRHPILRTAIVWQGLDEPLQVVRQRAALLWEEQDWRDLSTVERQEQLNSFLQADRKRGFDMSVAPLMRMALFCCREDAYEFVWSVHHILLDGWSLPQLLKEAFAFYEARRRGEEIQLRKSRPYRDYIAWLQQQALTKAEAFWRERLKGFCHPTSLPLYQANGSLLVEVESYGVHRIYLSTTTTQALQALARRHRLTLSTLIHAAWALLLNRYSGEEDLVFGTVVSGRPAALADVESMVGLFINTLPVRVHVSPDGSLLPWLQKLQAQFVELLQYEYSPLTRVHGWSEVPRDLTLFQSIVLFENYPVDSSSLWPYTSIRISNIRSVERTNYPLTLIAMPGSEMCLHVDYDKRHIDTADITRVMEHLRTLLEAMVANPSRSLVDLPPLPEAEQRLLDYWNQTETTYPKDRCIHQLFEEQVEKTPDAVAVVFEGEHLSYRELNQRSNQVAHQLQKLGVEPEMLVGICMDRSLEMVIGLLAILKAGGAYVPLDPDYPKERLAFMLEDTRLTVLLTKEHLLTDLPEKQITILCLDRDWPLFARQPVHNLSVPVTPDNLAYVIYTSGSTGTPKGVMVAHRGISNLAAAQIAAFDVQPHSRILQFAPLSFDASVSEVVLGLLSGAALHLAPQPRLLPDASLTQLLQQSGITTVTLPPSVLALLPIDDLPNLKTIVAAGEPCFPEIVSRWAKGRLFLNAYGPTETTVCATIAPCSADGRKPAIGRPIANTQVYILDRYLQPMPIGVPGELHIGGHGLARGYLNRPDLTAEKFIPNPFSKQPGARLYKTGDLGRHLPDGNIEFLGRLDHQIKIRGFRIEPGEIEDVLSQHSAVQETVVLALEDVPGEKRLIAYVVPSPHQHPASSELRSFLGEKLPEYMLPNAFIPLDRLPLTPNGKVDRRRLPAPSNLRPELQVGYEAPRSQLEQTIATVWQQVLHVERVGLHDNFFDLGGHSLLMIKAHSKLHEIFNRDIPLVELFSHPTPVSLAAYLSQDQHEQPSFEKIQQQAQHKREVITRQRQRMKEVRRP